MTSLARDGAAGSPATHDAKDVDLLRKHAKSFHLASLFLSRHVRRDVAVVYAFCRMADDLVDESEDIEQARVQLSELEAELLADEPNDALVIAFREVAERCGFGTGPAMDLLAGMRSDLGQVRVKDEVELELYCYRAAGTVGLMMTKVLGVQDPLAVHYAVSLGMAMQLTNICRDVLEDAHRDRLYLPASGLARRLGDSSGLPLMIQKALVLPAQRRAIVAAVRGLLERADDLYTFASHGFRFIPLRSRIAVGIAAALYRAIGVKLLRRQGGDPLLGRVMVSLPAKIALAIAACASVLVSPFRRRPAGLELSPFKESSGDCSPDRPQRLGWSSPT